MNDEFQSANEGLETSKEELQSLNEELTKVNNQLQDKVQELERSNNDITNLLGNTDIATVFMYSYLDAREVYRYVNRLYEQCFDCTADQILGKSVREILGDKNYAVIKPHLDKALAGESVRYEHTFSFPEEVRTMDVIYVPDKDTDGSLKGIFVIVHDITEAKALERKLQHSQERLRAIVANAADGILTIDRAGVIHDFNPAAEHIFGRSADAIGQDSRLLLPPGCRSCTDYPACFHGGHCLGPSPRPREIIGCRADGTLFPMELTVSEIDHLGLYVVLVRDQSERKALERQIIEASTLEQERIGREIHDGIGQQLTALSLLAASIERRLAAAGRIDDARKLEQLAGYIQDALAQARGLARGLSPVELDPEGLAEALVELANGVRTTSHIDCRFAGAPSIKVQDAVAAQHLYRIAQEAAHNALRHGKPRSILIALDSDDRGLTLTVTDDGVGVPKAPERSDGLGMHIMRYRAGIIGGQITVEPGPEGGTRVRCLVPAPG